MLPWQSLRPVIVVDYTFVLLSEAIFDLLQIFLTVAIQRVKMLPRQPYKGYNLCKA